MRLWITLTFDRGGRSPHSASVSRSVLTTSPAHAISTDRMARSFGPVIGMGPSGPVTCERPEDGEPGGGGAPAPSVAPLVNQPPSAQGTPPFSMCANVNRVARPGLCVTRPSPVLVVLPGSSHEPSVTDP